jgi:hypothetical protein
MATRFLTNNYIDICAFSDNSDFNTVTTWHTELPLDNVKKLSKSYVARSVDSNAKSIYGLFSEEISLNCFIICGHNFLEGVTCNLSLYSDRFTTLVKSINITIDSSYQYDSSSLSMTNLPIWITPTQNNIFSFKLTLTKNSAPINYFQIYRMFAGEYNQFSVGAALGNSRYFKDTTEQYRTDAGTLRSDYTVPSKIIEFDISAIKESERSDLSRALAYVGKRKEFFISTFAESCNTKKDIDFSGVVKLTKVPKYIEFANNIYNSKIQVEEV